MSVPDRSVQGARADLESRTLGNGPHVVARSAGFGGSNAATMNRSTWLKVVNSFYWLFLALWMGALVTTAAFAAITFPTLRDVGVIVPQYETIPIDEHFLIAAGSVMERAFFFLDLVQLCSAVVVAVGLGLHLTVF